MPEEQPMNPEAIKAACPFCKIVKGEIPSKKVFESDNLVAILDINPKAPGHTLLMPKEHYPILPLVPPEVFYELFCAAKKLSAACKKATDAQFANIFVANGAVAGQQSQHFMVHVIPNDSGGGFAIPDSGADSAQIQQTFEIFSKNLPAMVQNHLQRNPTLKPPAETKSDSLPRYADTKVVYEDGICVAILGKGVNGHVRVFAKGEAKSIEDISDAEISHLFFVASFAASCAFEGLKMQGTNLIVNNSDKAFCIDVVPRRQGDSLDFMWEPKPGNPEELEEIAKKIRAALGATKPSEKKQEPSKKPAKMPKSSPKKTPEREWQEFNFRRQDNVETLDEARNL